MDQNIFVWLSSLKAFHASMRRNPQSSSWEFFAHRRRIALTPLNYRSKSSIHLLHSTGNLGILTCHPQDELYYEVLPSFSNPNRPDPCLLIHCNQLATQQRTVGGQGRLSIS